MAELTSFGIALRKLRIEKRLKLLDLAKRLDVSAAYLSAIETGKKPIPDAFVLRISRALELASREIADLAKSVDRTRKEIRVDDKKEDDRELIAAFARRLDEVPSDIRERLIKLLMSIANEVPFARHRRGIVVPPLSTKAIRGFAEAIRNVFGQAERLDFPIIDVLEWHMPSIDSGFCLEVQTTKEMGENEGLVPIGRNRLILREDVYEGACSDNPRARFTASHELGHYLMHRKISFARARDDGDKIFVDSEWQADTFAATVLMSHKHAKNFRDAADMAAKCKVSNHAASVMWAKYLDDGIIPRAPELPHF